MAAALENPNLIKVVNNSLIKTVEEIDLDDDF